MTQGNRRRGTVPAEAHVEHVPRAAAGQRDDVDEVHPAGVGALGDAVGAEADAGAGGVGGEAEAAQDVVEEDAGFHAVAAAAAGVCYDFLERVLGVDDYFFGGGVV